jgi:hypothetical protein
MYTLIGTAKLNDVDPQAWLADVLARIADHPMHRLDELTPWNWAAGRDRRTLAAAPFSASKSRSPIRSRPTSQPSPNPGRESPPQRWPGPCGLRPSPGGYHEHDANIP